MKICRRILKSKREVFWHSKVKSEVSQPRQLWSSINSLLGRGRLSPTELLDAPRCIDFERFFDQKCSAIRPSCFNSCSPTYTDRAPKTNFSEFSTVTFSLVASTIRSFPNKQSSRDPLPTLYLKECLDLLSPLLTCLVNKSLSQGVFPKSLAVACVTPILKKNNSAIDELNSYRPISNLTVLSKLVERPCYKQLMSYLNDNDLLPVSESAYRRHHSTETVILRMMSDFLTSMDNGKVTLLASLDLSSAFDLVDHSILLHRLSSSFKLSSTVLKWFGSFLTERSQYIQFRGTFSSVHSVSFGVPQGSVLGPILFILYISDIIDIAKIFDLNVHVFADDIQLYGACSPSQVNLLSSRMSACVAALDSWLKTNSLHLNALKTNLMWIGTRQRLDQIDRRPIPVGAHLIHPASSLRCLGFTIDSTLSLSPHVYKILSSCFGTLRQLRSVRRSITRPLAISLDRDLSCLLQIGVLLVCFVRPPRLSEHPASVCDQCSCTICGQVVTFLPHLILSPKLAVAPCKIKN